jgi:hypothetical protein
MIPKLLDNIQNKSEKKEVGLFKKNQLPFFKGL